MWQLPLPLPVADITNGLATPTLQSNPPMNLVSYTSTVELKSNQYLSRKRPCSLSAVWQSSLPRAAVQRNTCWLGYRSPARQMAVRVREGIGQRCRLVGRRAQLGRHLHGPALHRCTCGRAGGRGHASTLPAPSWGLETAGLRKHPPSPRG